MKNVESELNLGSLFIDDWPVPLGHRHMHPLDYIIKQLSHCEVDTITIA